MPKVGDLLNERYRIKKVIGQGGMGRVYLAEDVAFRGEAVEVAVKENLQKEAKEQFLREAAVLARLRHASLPKVTDHFLRDDGTQYLVMEYVSGMDLREDVINHGSFTSEETATVGIRVCTVLEYLHSQDPPVIHRDIKPSNLKWAHFKPGVSREKQRKETSVVLIDFGIVKVGGATEKTRIGGHGMTLGYSPIEQDPDVGSEHTNERSDIYALGATLFFLATGKEPPISRVRVAEDTVDKGLTDVDPALRSIIKKAMAVYSQDRYQSAEEFRRALEGLFTQRPFLLEDATAEDDRVVLRWTLAEEADFEAYEIHASEEAEFTPSSSTLVETVTQCETTTITVRGLRRGAGHHLRVRLRMQSDRWRASNELSIHIPLPPPLPATLETPQSRRRSIALSWSPPADASHFEKYEVHSARVPGFTISEATLQHSIATHTNTKAVIRGLEPKTPYYFKVRIVNVDGQAAVSSEQVCSAKPAFRVRPGQVSLFILAMAFGAALISILNPGAGTDSWQNGVANVPGARGLRHTLNIASRDEQRVTLRRSRDEVFVPSEVLWRETLTEEQIDKRIEEETKLAVDEECGETLYYQLERIDWQGNLLDLKKFEIHSPLCEPRIEVVALPPDNVSARISWSWKGTPAGFTAYRFYVGGDEETLWTDANLQFDLSDFDQKNAEVDLQCGTNYVGLWIEGPDQLSINSEVVAVSGPECPPAVSLEPPPPPEPPSQIEIARTGETSAKVTWSWSGDSAALDGFRIVVEGHPGLEADAAQGNRSRVLSGLACNTEYRVKVLVHGSGGSVYSQAISYFHRCPLPVPGNVRVESGEPSHSSLIVSWDYGHADLLASFLVECADPAISAKTIQASSRQAVFGGLTENTGYRFRARAIAGQGDLSSSFSGYASGSTAKKKMPAVLSIPGDYEKLTDAVIAVSRARPEDLEQPGQPVTLRLEPNSTHNLEHSVTEEGYGFSALRFSKSTVIEGNNAQIRIRSSVAPNAILLDQPGKTLTLRNLTVDAGSLPAVVVTAGTLIIEACTIVSGNLNSVTVREGGRFVARQGSNLRCSNSTDGPRRSLLAIGSGASATLEDSQADQTIQARDGARLILTHATVTGDPESGVIFRAGASGSIERCVIKGGSHGVILNAPGEVRIMDSEIAGGPEGAGIYCESVGSNVSIVNVDGTKYGCP